MQANFVTGRPDESFLGDEESVLVASPFGYSTPPMPPRDEIANAKTTRAVAKIVDQPGTPDSVIRRLSFLNPLSSTESGVLLGVSRDMVSSPTGVPNTFGSPPMVTTVTKRRIPTETSLSTEFQFPVATPPANDTDLTPQAGTNEEFDCYSSEEGARFSLSCLRFISPVVCDSPLKSSFVRGSGDSGTGDVGGPMTSAVTSMVPALLSDCVSCGKQFISSLDLVDHVENFCRYRSGAPVCKSLSDSPALPAQVQRAATQPPTVAALPLSPSILGSPPVMRSSNEGIEDEISTFLECLKSDVAGDALEKTARQKMWALRRRMRNKQDTFQVSSEDDVVCEEGSSLRLVSMGHSLNQVPAVVAQNSSARSTPPLVPLQPLVSNISAMTSPIQTENSWDGDQSLLTNFFEQTGKHKKYVSGSPPTFGSFARGSVVCASSSGRPGESISGTADSVVTLAEQGLETRLEALPVLPCKSCGRKFAHPGRLQRHENVCDRVFKNKLTPMTTTSMEDHIPLKQIVSPRELQCKYCFRSFGGEESRNRHQAVCVSVFKKKKKSFKSSVVAGKPSPRAACLSVVRLEPVCIRAPQSSAKLSRETLARSVLCANNTARESFSENRIVDLKRSSLVSVSVQSETAPSESEVVGRSSLELQYHLLKEQIRNCSSRLKQRQKDVRFSDHFAYRDA